MILPETALSSRPAVLGINFGQSYASIAVIGKEGHASCIANEDGERQIACAISYNGEEVYIGNGAKPQLVKNGNNTIIGFRNLLGHTYDEVDHTAVFGAPLIPSSKTPAYTVDVLVMPPAPSAPSTRAGSTAPPAPSAPSTRAGSTAPSGAATPAPREPEATKKTISVPEVTTLFLSTLFQSASDFLGVSPSGTVISCPAWFSAEQREALKTAAAKAGIPVLQILEETAAVLVGYRVGLTKERQELALLGQPEEGHKGEREDRDKTVVVVDLGETSLNVAVCKTGEGEYVKLAQGRELNLGGKSFDDLLCQHFAKEFTKKTKVALTIPCTESSSQADKRAEAKLRLAVEHTKRSLSASSGAATCAVESLKDGMDLSGSINRMRFDGLAASVYRKVADKAKAVIAEAGLDICQIDEVLLAGASTLFPGLAAHLSLVFPPTTPVTSALDPSEVIAIGCALQALHLSQLPAELKVEDVLRLAESPVDTTAAPIGIVVPGQSNDDLLNAVVVPSGLALPVRRRVEIPVAQGTEKVAFEVWEGKDEVKVDVLDKAEKTADDEDDEYSDEEDEPEEVRTPITKKTTLLAGLELALTDKSAKSVLFEVMVQKGGKVDLRLWQSGKESEAAVASI
ncbi:hypothetical protein QFC21_005480 [Naganishia friedmannii]|uniref:Uncharacterized protein n=1 Tax=Naganishia friedmannii TaxID=89922 RepID=A0ACC2V9F5_9TREE|nr:hypothetical protein QFC21_005480 [Naganishia friedmannii]